MISKQQQQQQQNIFCCNCYVVDNDYWDIVLDSNSLLDRNTLKKVNILIKEYDYLIFKDRFSPTLEKTVSKLNKFKTKQQGVYLPSGVHKA